MTTQNTTNEYLFTVTGFSDDGDRVAAPLVLANAALAVGGDVLMWLTLEGVQLARKGAVDALRTKSFPAVATLLEAFIENGGRIGVCPPCGKTHGIGDADLVASAEWMGGAAVIAAAGERRTMTF
jgi:predicted peroxiredoxin